MRKILLILLVCVFAVTSSVMAIAPFENMTDNTLVSDAAAGGQAIMGCLEYSNTTAKFKMTGTIGDTFIIYEDGAAIYTVTLKETIELWERTGPMQNVKVDWTLAGSGGAKITCFYPFLR